MPRKGQALKGQHNLSSSFISTIFSKRRVNFEEYQQGNASIDYALQKGLFFDISKDLFSLKEDQFVEGLGNEAAPDLTPLFNDQLIVLVSGDSSADLREVYDRRGHQLLIADGGKRSYVLITNLIKWEVFSVTGLEMKYSVDFSDKNLKNVIACKNCKTLKTFHEDFISSRSKKNLKLGGTQKEALKLIRFGKFPTLVKNPLAKEDSLIGAFQLGPNDVLIVLNNEDLFKKKENSYRETLRTAFGSSVYLTFVVITDTKWIINSPYLESETKGTHGNLKILRDSFASIVDSVLSCRREIIKKKIGELVDTWNSDPRRFYDDNEAQTRSNFIDDMLKSLGYRFKAEGSEKEEVFLESTSAAEGRPDYAVRVDGRVLFFFEAKKPKIDCSDWSNCSQAVRYSWSRGNVPLAILSNFRELKVLLAKTNPTEDNYSQLIIPELSISSENKAQPLDKRSYQELADYLVNISREAVASGRFDEWLMEIGVSIQEEVPVTTKFLETINTFRLALSEGLPKSYQKDDLINPAINQLLNRILFIRVAEDRRVLDDRSLWNRLKKWESRGKKKISLGVELLQFFREIENHFNAGLFESNDTFEKVPFSDKSLSHVIENLYLPFTEYHFAVLRPEIIGVAYEQALAQKISFSPAGKPKLVEKDELQSENGIYYTPEFVVDYIVRNTIRPVLETKGLEDNFRIADIACGSGAFLVAAYRELLRFEKDSLEKDVEESLASKALVELRRGSQQLYSVSIPRRRDILVNHIFGMDVDAEACEKAKLGLFLVMMEDVLDFEKRKRVLPSLDSNIIGGNTIFETDYAGDTNSMYCKHPVDIFDKTQGFGSLSPAAAKNGVFDIIVGNPPYINVEKLKGKLDKKKAKQKKGSGEEVETPVSYLQRKYPTSAQGRTDLYCVFIERGLELLKSGGTLGYITPDKWYYEPYGELLREEILNSHTVEKLVIVGEKVFKSAFRKCPMVPAAITILKKGNSDKNRQTVLEDYRTGYRTHFADSKLEETDYHNRFSLAPLSKVEAGSSLSQNFNSTFRVLSTIEREIVSKVRKSSFELGEVAYVNWGLRPKSEKLIEFEKDKPASTFGLVKGEDFSSGFYTGPANAIIYKAQNIHPGRMGYPILMGMKRILIAKVTGEEGIRAVVDSKGNYNDDSASMVLLYSDISRSIAAKKKDKKNKDDKFPSEMKDITELEIARAKKFSYDYIHGILCSKLTSFYHSTCLTNELNVYPEHVRKLRITHLEESHHFDLIAAISKEIQSFNSVKDSNRQAVATCKQLVRAIDRLIYDDYGLSDSMIECIEDGNPSDIDLPDLKTAVNIGEKLAA